MAVNYSRSYYSFKYPSEQVVTVLSTLARNYDFSGKKALDFGFGAGRHLKLFKDFGFDAYGIDVTTDAIDTMHDMFGAIVPKKNIVIGNILENEHLFPENNFDLVLCFSIAYVFKYNDMLILLERLTKMLKPGGLIVSNFRTKFDSNYKYSEDSADIYGAKDSHGKYFTYLDINDLEKVFKHLNIGMLSAERYDRYPDNNLVSYWIASGVKK